MTVKAWIVTLALAATTTAATAATAAQLRYDKEYPEIGYASSTPRDAIARLQQRIDTGAAKLKFEAPNGYLSSVLRELAPSVDLYTPSPYETELRGLASPVPTHSTSLFLVSVATQPIETVAS